MKDIITDIIPKKPIFIGEKKTLDKKAICVFAATGFFLDQDTYYKEQKILKPSFKYKIDAQANSVVSGKPYFKWHYTPIERPLKKIVAEFAQLFETIIKEQVTDKNTILPLSGGLDSRTQAAALYHLKIPVKAYSYAFKGGHDETYYANKIAKLCNFSLINYKVEKGYLWDSIDRLAKINLCYSEFTHPRQMAFVDEYKSLGSVFSLGHWGDVLFDDMGVSDDLSQEKQVNILLKKIVKKGGMELAISLWESWKIEGDFKDYLLNRIKNLLEDINIKNNANAQIRAFKSMYWAPRWTSINLSVFEDARPITLPYYDNRMCEFICSIPEKFLSGRQIQIEYIKLRMPELAKITWQDHRPFNLYNYHFNTIPWNLPFRIINKIKRMMNPKPYIQRNWELQFIGSKNESELENRLFNNPRFAKLVSPKVAKQFYELFQNDDAVYYSHSVSMLLTLAVFSEKLLDSKDEF